MDYILNTISVDWTKVDHIDSKQLFLVRTQNGVVYIGALASPETPDRRPLELDVWEGSEKMVTLKRSEVILWGNLNWNFTFYANWDNRPPPGFATSDHGASSSLSISFGTPIHL